MRILHIVNDATSGGAQRFLTALAEADESNELHLAVLRERGPVSRAFERAFESVTYLGASSSYVRAVKCFPSLTSLTRALRPAIRHSHLAQSDLLNLTSPSIGAKRVSTIHNSTVTGRNAASRFVTKAALRLSRRFDAVVGCDASASELAQRMSPRAMVVTIPNGVPIPAVAARSGAWSKTFLSLARWDPQKAHEVLLEAFAEVRQAVPEARLALAGDGLEPSNPELQATIRRFGLEDASVDLLGFVTDPSDLLSTSRALVFSSDFEGLPIAGLQALANGLPVIATNVGGCRRLAVRSDWLVPARRPHELARAMLSVLQLNESDYEEACSTARAIALRDFNIQGTVRNYQLLYERITDIQSAG